MHFAKRLFIFLTFAFVLVACNEAERALPTAVPSTPAAVTVDEATASPLPATDDAAPLATKPTLAQAGSVEPTSPPAAPSSFTWPTPAASYMPLSRAKVTDAEWLAHGRLITGFPPDRNDSELLGRYRGHEGAIEASAPVAAPLPVGSRQDIAVSNADSNVRTLSEYDLKFVSDHAYFWFDTTEGLAEPTETQLAEAGAGFDQIYRQSQAIFGTEANPGVDGDPRIHIVNSSPLNLCDLTPEQIDFCWLAGYFSSRDLVPAGLDPGSNAREMFVMNGRHFGQPGYLETLGHEFRHMIEENYDVNDWDWEVEGSAMLAEELLGFPSDGVARANTFILNPDQQLNRWSETDRLPHYGQAYLFNRYLLNRLGVERYRQFATDPAPAFTSLDSIAATTDSGTPDGLGLWLDWLAALAIHDQPQAEEKYAIVAGLDAVQPQLLSGGVETTVNQYAADYYELVPGQGSSIAFAGSNHVPLLATQPTSGSHMWVANRANYSSAQLTQAFDLSAVANAILTYDVYRDIEAGYDFAYVTVSNDGGQTWQPLAGTQMQGAQPTDDPGEAALADHFYTGRAPDWVREEIDLTPFAGGEILVRFEYVTDPILTYGGLALDNIAIPEIGYFDDGEADGAWQADGFVRSTGYLPQSWHLQLISFTESGPVVEVVTLNPDNTAVVPIPASTIAPPILIVAATAPMTLEPATYRLAYEGMSN